MDFMSAVGKKIINKETGEVMVVNSVGKGTHVILTEENKRENWIGFLVGSPMSEVWEIFEEKEEVMIVIGIDIATDCKIPKGTICYGHKNKDGITVIDKIGRYSLIEEKKTLSDKIDVVISRGYGIPNAPAILVPYVKESIMDFFVWVTTEHAPGLSSDVVAQKMKEIFGDKLIK